METGADFIKQIGELESRVEKLERGRQFTVADWTDISSFMLTTNYWESGSWIINVDRNLYNMVDVGDKFKMTFKEGGIAKETFVVITRKQAEPSNPHLTVIQTLQKGSAPLAVRATNTTTALVADFRLYLSKKSFLEGFNQLIPNDTEVWIYSHNILLPSPTISVVAQDYDPYFTVLGRFILFGFSYDITVTSNRSNSKSIVVSLPVATNPVTQADISPPFSFVQGPYGTQPRYALPTAVNDEGHLEVGLPVPEGQVQDGVYRGSVLYTI